MLIDQSNYPGATIERTTRSDIQEFNQREIYCMQKKKIKSVDTAKVDMTVSIQDICGTGGMCAGTMACVNANAEGFEAYKPKPPPRPTPTPHPSPTPKPDDARQAVITKPKNEDQKPETTRSAGSNPSKAEEQSRGSGANNPRSSGNQSSDYQTCQQMLRSAQDCCYNPSSCGGSSGVQQATYNSDSSSGLRDYCSQLKSATDANTKANLAAANTCINRYTRCAETCGSYAQSYPEQADSFSSVADSCRGLSSRANTLISQSQSSNEAVGAGDKCDQMAQAQPSNAGGGPQQASNNSIDPYGCQSNPSSQSCQQCSSNPNSAACQNALAAQSKPAEQGQGSFGTPANQGHGSFNLADNSDAAAPQLGFGGQAANAPTYKTIANNSGGGIPGAGGGGQPASLGGSGKKGGGGGPAASGSVTDIDEGMRSGGYSQPVGGGGGGAGGVDTSGSEVFGARRPASNGGLDLKQYLPGGARDPNTRFGAGGLRPPGTEIHGKHVDMWSRITQRMIEKCKIGELYGCS